ncbi:hypothetical protein NDU88_007165 [Pleurodeles waltl]|uniref:Uncharacterized protein n=1 Tax=Pleurodeles waltl TaxID=8319 RepID=A0AAV7QMX6_PLEWA|nr:hypothetical protein NDU88_007165 [Pleurodeles waltl]
MSKFRDSQQIHELRRNAAKLSDGSWWGTTQLALDPSMQVQSTPNQPIGDSSTGNEKCDRRRSVKVSYKPTKFQDYVIVTGRLTWCKANRTPGAPSRPACLTRMRYHQHPVRRHIRVTEGLVNPSTMRRGRQRQDQEEELRKRRQKQNAAYPKERSDVLSESAPSMQTSGPRVEMMAVSSLTRRPEDQEAATPDNRPHSG